MIIRVAICIFTFVCIFLVCVFGPELWGEINGTRSLGNHLSFLFNDQPKEWCVVICSQSDFGQCIVGEEIIPGYQNHYDKNGEYAEYVETAISDKDWVITRTFRIKEKKRYYWIISKAYNIEGLDRHVNIDSIIKNYITGPVDSIEYEKKRKELHMKINFKN